MKDLGRIRRLFYRDGLSLSEISRKTGYSRNTVKRWLRTPEGTEPRYERQNPNERLAPLSAPAPKTPAPVLFFSVSPCLCGETKVLQSPYFSSATLTWVGCSRVSRSWGWMPTRKPRRPPLM